ncbi:MAG: restriction endonuclease subunit S, partial [Muribaculaceae bacterium]|nr:restriction endonuclease subunit S [Muribaculaceae bacterium]
MEDKKQGKKLNVPNLRFPEYTREWERYSLSDLVNRVVRKNKNNKTQLPLTISAQYGLVDQVSFFNKKVASQDMSNYYLIKKGEFAYNKSYSGNYPWGAVKRLEFYDEGALSSLYICFSVKNLVDSDFLKQYFESSKWHRGISEIAGEGARNHGLLNISVEDYFNTGHYIPPTKDEQQKIGKLISLIDERITTQSKIIEKLQSLMSGINDYL